jgi:hypothetical protein
MKTERVQLALVILIELLRSIRLCRDVPRPDKVVVQKIIDQLFIAEDLRTEKTSVRNLFVMEVDQEWTALEQFQDPSHRLSRTRRTSSIDSV